MAEPILFSDVQGDSEDFEKKWAKYTISDEVSAENAAKRAKAEADRIEAYNAEHGTPEARRLMRCGFGRREAEAAFSATGEDWLKKCNLAYSRLREDKETIVISGECGTGKTVMAAHIAHDFLTKNKRVTYIRAADFFIKLKSTWKKETTMSEEEFIHQYELPDLLIVDEIQDRGSSDWENTLLNTLIDKRYSNLKATLILTNKTGQTATDQLPTSIQSRIKGSGSHLACTWTSFRHKN